jgi:hypothetical protein
MCSRNSLIVLARFLQVEQPGITTPLPPFDAEDASEGMFLILPVGRCVTASKKNAREASKLRANRWAKFTLNLQKRIC